MINTATSNISNYGNTINSILGNEGITSEGLIEQLTAFDESFLKSRLIESLTNFGKSTMMNKEEAQVVNEAIQTLKQ